MNNNIEGAIMKLSVESYTLMQKLGDFKGLEVIKQAGFDCVDMSYYWQKEDSRLLGDDYREHAIQLRNHLDQLGLVCNQAHAPFDFKYGMDLNDSNPDYLAITRAIESASILGAKNIVIHSIILKENSKIIFDREYNIAYFKSFLPLCERFNIRIAVENLFTFDDKRSYYRGRLGKASELTAFIRELNSPYFVACVDIGHAAMTENEPEHFIAGMDNTLLQALHVQDGNYRVDCHTLPYLGDFNWTAIMQALKNIDYKGELNFEIVKYLRNVPEPLLLDALTYAEKVGRYLISIFQNHKS